MTEPTLPERAAALAARWGLVLEARFPLTPGSRDNFVAPALGRDGARCVLKVSPRLAETRAEMAALRVWDGVGAARLLAVDPDLGGLLLERIEPGTMLAQTAAVDDDTATRIAAGILRTLWRPAVAGDLEPSEFVPSIESLVPLEVWCAAYARNRAVLSHGVRGFPGQLFQHADSLRADLLASTDAPHVLHGDLHHFNILRSERAGWLAIDPKGLVGDRCFDVCQLLRNPGPMPPAVNSRRLDILCAELGLDPRRTRQWCLVHAVLDACWSFEQGEALASSVGYAEQTLLF